MLLDDSTLGKLILIVSIILYVYYTFWIYGLPFADEDNFVTLFFPPIRYALIVPAICGTLFIGSILLFIFYTFCFS